MRKTFALYVILATLLCGHAIASRTASPGEYRGFVDQPAGWIQAEEGGDTILIVERRHEFLAQRSGGEAETVYRYQYLYFSEVRPEQRQGEKAARLHPGFDLVVASGIQEERADPAGLAPRLPEPTFRETADSIQDVIDELEGYKTTLGRIAARSAWPIQGFLNGAVAGLNQAIAKLNVLLAGAPPPGIEGQIEGHLDAAIGAITMTGAAPNSTLGRIKAALQYLRANLF